MSISSVGNWARGKRDGESLGRLFFLGRCMMAMRCAGRFLVLILPMMLAAANAGAQMKEGGRNEFGVFRIASADRFVPLVHPRYVSAKEAALDGGERVVGVVIGDDARCFPIRQMWFHHIVNDTIGGRNLAVTYCIMANTAVNYVMKDSRETLAIAGLFGGVLAMHKKGSDQVWAQIAEVPVPDNPTSGLLELGPPAAVTTFAKWKARYPKTLVLAPIEKYSLYYEAYDKKPKGYNVDPLLNETVATKDRRFGPGEDVFGVAIGQDAEAWTMKFLREHGSAQAKIAGKTVKVLWDPGLETARVDGEFPGFAMRSYWYAWISFYPRTRMTPASEGKQP